MKNNIWKVIVTCSLLCTIVCMIQIGSLKTEIQNTKNQLNNQISRMENSFWQSSSNMEEILKQGASILAKAEWEYGAFDTDALTVDILCSVTPKEYDPAKTTASILLGNTEIPMTYENGTYRTKTSVSLFEETKISKVLFYEGDVIRAEGLDWVFMPLSEYLPSIDAYLGGNSMQFDKKDTVSWSTHGGMDVFVGKKEEGYSVTSVTLVRCLDEREVDRVELQLENDQDFSEDYFFEVDLNYEIPFGTTQDIFVDIEDTMGFRCRVCVDHTTITEDGDYDNQYMHYESEKILYDRDGKELYRGFW